MEDDEEVLTNPTEEANSSAVNKLSPEHILADSCQLVADSLGVELLQRKAASHLSREVIFKVKLAIQHAERFRRKAKRSRMSPKDINDALMLQSGEGQMGITCKDFVPLKGATGVKSSNDIYVCDEEEINLNEILQSSLPKYPAECHMKCHWLVVDGKQPSVPENPLMVDRPKQMKASLSTPTVSHGTSAQNGNSAARKANASNANSSAPQTNATPGAVKTKPVRFHELSLEQQLYFKEITEACMNTNEERKSEALASLSTDPGLHALLPRFSAFITHGVRLNVLHRSLAILIYLMRMLSALLNNPNISLEKYLHELVPSVFTCIVNRQLVDQHWALRSFAAKCLAMLCQTYSNNVNNLLPRSVNILKQALSEMHTIGFPTLYGVACALGELGNDTIKSVLIPQGKSLGILIQDTLQQCARREHQQQQSLAAGANNGLYDSADDAMLKKGAQELQTKLTKVLAAFIVAEMTDLTEFNDFKAHFGYLGAVIYNEVTRLRQNQQQTQSAAVSYVSPIALRMSPGTSPNPNQTMQRHNVGVTSQHQMRGVPRVAMQQGMMVQGRHMMQSPQTNYINSQTLPRHPQQTFVNGSMTSPPDSKDFQISPANPNAHFMAQQQAMISPHQGHHMQHSQISPNGAQFVTTSNHQQNYPYSQNR
ncbi:transcription initiation factor TFIID subunit 6-like isoform X2 [Symsagittifera roscoffensis]|uniref:transcription initiation factor TFIID subunit 6-like isoform X2 n=1 Tax=Symsagittifera roscoffensis TaxID=84072 RepID=UPI00307C7BCD